MNAILLSGGSGKRLWPLSNDVRSKQFIKLFKNNDEYESMVQRVYRQITTVDADAKITIATRKSQASAIKNQLGEGKSNRGRHGAASAHWRCDHHCSRL